jgi:hypothetical protein
METRGVDPAELSMQLRQVLVSIEAGELTCSAAGRHRIEGAVLTLSTVADHPETETVTASGRDPAAPD